MMSLDDGTADGQPDSHAVAFGGVERFEEPVRSLSSEADPHIFHAKAHPIALVSFRPYQQLPRTIVDRAHRVRSVPEQVQDDLLELDTIARDGREVLGQFCP